MFWVIRDIVRPSWGHVSVASLTVCASLEATPLSPAPELGQSQADTEDIETLRRAAEQGDAEAQRTLGVKHVEGDGVPQDDTEAIRWFRLAADQGNAGAQRNLGVAHAQGDGVPQDDAEAVRWYRLAADQGNANAQTNLGLMHGEGRGVPQDDAEAARWLRLAADQGHAGAQRLLGLIDAGGGGEPTLQDALEVPAVGLSQGYRQMESYLDSLSLAEGGSTIQTPEGTIDQGNVQQYRERFEARLAIYRAAIEQRGYESFAGNYDASATESCSRAGSAWAGLVSEGAARGVEIVQEGFAIQLTTRFELDGEIQSIETQPVAVESVMTFDDFGNSDYSLVGEIEDGKIVVKPDDNVLDTWPQWANPPKREDLRNCTVTLEVSSNGGTS